MCAPDDEVLHLWRQAAYCEPLSALAVRAGRHTEKKHPRPKMFGAKRVSVLTIVCKPPCRSKVNDWNSENVLLLYEWRYLPWYQRSLPSYEGTKVWRYEARYYLGTSRFKNFQWFLKLRVGQFPTEVLGPRPPWQISMMLPGTNEVRHLRTYVCMCVLPSVYMMLMRQVMIRDVSCENRAGPFIPVKWPLPPSLIIRVFAIIRVNRFPQQIFQRNFSAAS